MINWLLSLFRHYGNAVVFITTFLNSIGIPLPGEPILFGTGFILAKEKITLWGSIAAAIAACFVGGETGFWVGRWLGYRRLKKIHWLHFTPEKFKKMKHYFKRYGAKTVFIARFIALLPGLIPNVLAGMGKMRWSVFLFFNLAGSVIYSVLYILLGFFFMREWEFLKDKLGPTAIYLILQGILLLILAFIFRHFLYRLWARIFLKKKRPS